MVFGPTPVRGVVGGVAEDDVEAAFPDWEIVSVQPAETAGLGWPLSRTDPLWCRLRRSEGGQHQQQGGDQQQ